MCKQGIDYSDEGKYLLDSQDPNLSPGLVTFYGFFYHPVMMLINSNIPYFRFSNILITFLVASISTSFSLKYLGVQTNQRSTISLVISAHAGLISLAYFSVSWLPTPSYNSLTFQTTLICLVAIFRYLYFSNGAGSFYNLAFLSASFSFLFLAKPTSFFCLYSLFLLTAAVEKKMNLKFIIKLTFFSLVSLLAFSILIYGDLFGLFRSISLGLGYTQLLSSSYDLSSQLRLDVIPIWVYRNIILGLLCLLLIVLVNKNLFGKHFSIDRLKIAFLIGGVILLANFDFVHRFFGMSLIAVSTFIFLGFSTQYFTRDALSAIPKFILVVPFLPLAAAAGTNNNLWAQSSLYVFFTYLFGLLLYLFLFSKFQANDNWFPISLVTIFFTFAFIVSAGHEPYRQLNALNKNHTSIDFNSRVSGMKLTASSAKQLTEISRKIAVAGFRPDTHLIDFSGQSPTTLFLFQARAVGDSWLIGGYEGSNMVAIKKLKRTPCAIFTESWLLIEEGGPRSLDSRFILKQLDTSLNDYEKVVSWFTPAGAGGYREPRAQDLYRPKLPKGKCTNP